ncbi:MAG: SBBP repeat-containing protein, partial [bacterium]
MRKLIFISILLIIGLVLYVAKFKTGSGAKAVFENNPVPSTQVKVQASYGQIPMHFEPNQGQVAEEVAFVSRGRGYTLFLTPTEAVLTLRKPETEELQAGHSSSKESLSMPSLKAMASFPPEPQNKKLETRNSKPETLLKMKLVGANPAPEVKGVEELPGKSNYFIGKDPKQWRTNVPNYARVQYRDIYPGVDLLYYGNPAAAGQLEYDFVVAPGADPEAITLAFEGTEGQTLDSDGNLKIELGGSEVLLTAPVVYQEVQGTREPVDGQYILLNGSQVGLDIAEYDPHLPLVIDPVALAYSTFLGGDAVDVGEAIALDASGNIYVTGWTSSTDFPSVSSIQPSFAGVFDAFVLKLDPSGSTLLFSTYLGGAEDDRAHDIAVDASGNIYLTGETASSNFPTANAFQPENSCGFACDGDIDDAFVTKLNPMGNGLIYSTYIGGFDGIDHHDRGFGIAVDGEGNAYVTGETFTADFPITAGAYIPRKFEGFSFSGRGDAFVTKFSPAGDTLYSTFLGQFSVNFEGLNETDDDIDDRGFDIAVDSEGKAYVVGRTEGTTFPTTEGAFQRTNGGFRDVFITILNTTGSDVVHSTYLGGTDDEFEGMRISLDSERNVYITGETRSEDFPTTPGAFQET